MLRQIRPPARPMLEHGVEHGQQFPHAGDERHLLGFAHSTQALIERLDCRVVPCRHDGRHTYGIWGQS